MPLPPEIENEIKSERTARFSAILTTQETNSALQPIRDNVVSRVRDILDFVLANHNGKPEEHRATEKATLDFLELQLLPRLR